MSSLEVQTNETAALDVTATEDSLAVDLADDRTIIACSIYRFVEFV